MWDPDHLAEGTEKLIQKSVLIIEDHALAASGLASAMDNFDDIKVVDIAANAVEGIARIKALQPDCVVVDLKLPDANGLEVFTEGRRWSPESRFAVLTGNPSAAIFSSLLEDGVSGIFMKADAPDVISEGIRQIAKGNRKFSKSVLEMIARNGQHKKLTAREMEVLQAIARGMTNPQIAEHLKVSPKTLESHRTSLMRKMSVHSTATLMIRAISAGLIETTENTSPSAPSQLQ